MEEIMFLPSGSIDMFLAMETPMDKLRYAVKALAKSHNVEYNLDELEYLEEYAYCAEPYASLRGHNVPLLMDCRMLVDYLNSIEPYSFDTAATEIYTITYTRSLPDALPS